MTVANQDQIQSLIPHRKPMLLVDEVIEQADKHIICKKTFSSEDFFVQGHFPGFPLVPGVILCECCLQSGAILLSQFTPNDGSVPVATRIDGAKFKRMVRPGDSIEIHVTLNEVISTAYFMTGKVYVDGNLAARLDFACSVAKPDAA